MVDSIKFLAAVRRDNRGISSLEIKKEKRIFVRFSATRSLLRRIIKIRIENNDGGNSKTNKNNNGIDNGFSNGQLILSIRCVHNL